MNALPIVLIGGAALLMASADEKKSTPAYVDPYMSISNANKILGAPNAETALEAGNAMLQRNVISPYAPGSPDYVAPVQQTPQALPNVAGIPTGVNPGNYADFQSFYEAFMAQNWTPADQALYASQAPAEVHMETNAWIRAVTALGNKRSALRNQASDLYTAYYTAHPR